jgi:hypothetical protein
MRIHRDRQIDCVRAHAKFALDARGRGHRHADPLVNGVTLEQAAALARPAMRDSTTDGAGARG